MKISFAHNYAQATVAFIRRHTAKLGLAMAIVAIGGAPVIAQVAERTPATQVSSSAKKIGFRVSEWKTIHSHDASVMQTEMQTLTKIGCEVTTASHGDHVDLKYRCSNWKTIEVPTDELSKQWTAWLADKEMETVIINPSADYQQPTLRFRMTAPRTLHLHDAQAGQQIIDTLKMIQVEVTTHSHGDHLDAKFQSPDWKSIGLANEPQAQAWKKWLDEAGFETQMAE